MPRPPDFPPLHRLTGSGLLLLAVAFLLGGVAVAVLMQRHEGGLAAGVILLLSVIGAALLYWRIVPMIARIRQAEADLSRWRHAFEHAGLGLVLCDPALDTLNYVNPAFARMHGYTVAELTGRPVADMFPPELHDAANCNVALAHEKGQHMFETWHARKDGSRFPVQIDITAVKDDAGKVLYRVASIQDISERHAAVSALREREATLSQAQAQAQLGSWWLDIPTNSLTWSDECYRIFGIPPGTPLTYEAFLACVHPDDRDHVDTMWRAAAHGKPYDIQHRLLNNGQVRWVRERAELEFHPDGTLWRGVGTTQDITELKHKEEELQRSRRLLRDLAAHHEQIREEERTRIAREVHDELGQYLTALRMDAALLRIRFGTDNPDLQQQVAHMKQTIDTTIGVVRNVVTALRPAALDMGLIPATEWLLASFKERTGTSVQLDAPGHDLGLNNAQITAVFRILQESLTNIARHAEARQVQVLMRRNGKTFTMRIADDGIGFDSKMIRRRKTFGLMGIRERAMTFGGRAKFTSHPGQGTTVHLTLPISPESPA